MAENALKNFYQKHEKWWPTVFFFLGVIYDIATLDPIDSLIAIARQGVFLVIIATLIGLSLAAAAGKWVPTGRVAKMWAYQEAVVHFLLGGLLSEYTLFFLKSSSLWSSSVFLLILAALIFINEFKQISGHTGIPLRSALFAICVVSYFVSIVALALGFVGILPFILALAVACAVFYFFIKRLRISLPEETRNIDRRMTWPFAAVILGFLILYFTKLIPPIPLALKYAGVFHDIKKINGKYLVSYDPRGTSVFQSGTATFITRKGDKPYFFFRIFSPGRISDQVQVRWMLKDQNLGWQTADLIPVSISGGREDGFRGFTFKSNFQPGKWQVRVETTDSREVGRLYFDIENDENPESSRELVSESH